MDWTRDRFPDGRVVYTSPAHRFQTDALRLAAFAMPADSERVCDLGTGCGSIVTALTLEGLVSGKNVKVSMPGGELFVTLTHESGTAHDVYLTGPTCVVFEGETKEI